MVLPGIVPSFPSRLSRHSLEVIVEEGFVDVLASGCDAGIRYDERLEQDMIAFRSGHACRASRPLLPRNISTAMAGRNIARSALTCVFARPFAGGAKPTWDFERDGEVVRLDPTGPLLVRPGGGTELAIDAAVAGRYHLFFEGLAAPASG